MVKEIIMPKLGETMEEGVVGKWVKKEGDWIEKGEIIFEVMTDKANFEVEASVGGFLRKIVVPASENAVPVTTVIGFIAESMDEAVPEVKATVPKPKAPDVRSAGTVAAPALAGPASSGVRASPRARKLAQDKGVDLERIKGTGPGGRIVEKDVEAAATSPTAAVPAGAQPAGEGLSGMRKVIARRMSAAKREIPHVYLNVDIDITRAAEKRPDGASFNDLIVKAAARALEKSPQLNALFENDRLIRASDINVCVAVSLERGLVTPVVRKANKLSLTDIGVRMGQIKEKAKSSKFSPEDLAGGTFTVSNLGMFEIDSFAAIINPPQVALLAVGRIRDAAAVVAGAVTARKIVTVTLSLDHRAADGADGARYLKRLKELLETQHGQL